MSATATIDLGSPALAFDASRAESYLLLPYDIRVRYDHADGCFVVTVTEIPDFFALGNDETEAAANFPDAFLSHVRGYLASNKPVPRPAARGRTALTANNNALAIAR